MKKDLRLGRTWARADHSSSFYVTEMNLFTPESERETEREQEERGKRKEKSSSPFLIMLN